MTIEDEFELGDLDNEARKIKRELERKNARARESFRKFGDEDLEIEE